jgi:hypothetical protein
MNFQNKSIYPKYKSKKPKLLLNTNKPFNITLVVNDSDANKKNNKIKNVYPYNDPSLLLLQTINKK